MSGIMAMIMAIVEWLFPPEPEIERTYTTMLVS